MIVPTDGERIFHIVPPNECPALKGVIVKPLHAPINGSLLSPLLAPYHHPFPYLEDEQVVSSEVY